MSDKAILAARGLTVTIAGIGVCRELDFSVVPGQCWAILGRNGAGKTTLLHTLAGLRAPTAGTIALNGRPLAALSAREVARTRGLLTQDDSDAFGATVLETAMIGRHPYLSRWQWESADDLRIAREALALMDIADAEQRDVRTLSGGERRRVALAALLTQRPRLFLLDEPSSHLDLAHQLAVLRRLTTLAREQRSALIMVLHDVNLARRFCDHVLMLDQGTAIAGPASELLTAERLSKIYGVALKTLGQGEELCFVPN
ncbi:MAG TPA: ABC transporter ATP-binding protein [Casimicrobiaceae bacterium]|jgi:iron complex transport system ATP-binding protein|nr:ABC transporter ATP-binding protein [Casimicrobiaceae bacterium]